MNINILLLRNKFPYPKKNTYTNRNIPNAYNIKHCSNFNEPEFVMWAPE